METDPSPRPTGAGIDELAVNHSVCACLCGLRRAHVNTSAADRRPALALIGRVIAVARTPATIQMKQKV
jgi:hypothetical protein